MLKKIIAVIKLATKVPNATPKTFKFIDKTKKELNNMFNVDRVIIKRLEIFVFEYLNKIQLKYKL